MAAVRVIISLGSNVDADVNIRAALAALRGHELMRVQKVSRTYASPAEGPPGQPPFLNAAVLMATELSVEDVRSELREIEAQLGRVRSEDRYAPRSIDLDLVVYDADQEDENLIRFGYVLLPAAEVDPEWIHQERGLTLSALAHDFDDKELTPVNDSTLPARYSNDLEGDPGEVYDEGFEATVRDILVRLQEDPHREGLQRTPLRVAKALDFLTGGYTRTLDEVVNNAIFDQEGEEMVLVKDIEYYSLCEHHMLPFFGKAHVAYTPNGSIIGLSKIARIVDLFARRLQVQERLSNQVADGLMEVLNPHGVGVVMEGSHFCMMMRGVQKQGSQMVTSALRGTFKTNAQTRTEFLDLVRG